MQKIYLLLLSIILTSAVSAQRNGTISGKLVDASNQEPLFFANVSLEGTSLGSVTNEDGDFEIKAVPPGDYTVVLLYVGYITQEIPVTVNAGETVDLGTKELKFESIRGEEVVVTGQLRGQASAINQQVKSNTIVNVVSKEKIQEVPDANAAESLSRLPGITIGRSGGEGSKITVRGVSPRFNSITVNGQVLPATSAGNRSVDLSMISSDILDGIEVYKALTPDMDGDAVGGTVNLVTKTADAGLHGRVQLESGYHGLINDIGTYKGSFNIGNRFFDNKFGVIIGGNFHRANRNSDFFDADYEYAGTADEEATPENYEINNVELRNRIETRDRYGFSATVDYQFKRGDLIFDQFYTETSRDIVNRGIRARLPTSNGSYNFNYNENYLTLNSSQLRGNFNVFDNLELNFSLARSVTKNRTPVSYGTGGQQSAVTEPDMPSNVSPQDVPRYLRFDLERTTGGQGFGWSDSEISDENYTAQLDLESTFSVGSWLSGNIKIGGKLRQKNRDRSGTSWGIFDWDAYFLVFSNKFPDYNRNSRTYFTSNFIDDSYTGYDFPFGDQYELPFVFDEDIIASHYAAMHGIDSLWFKNFEAEFDRYDAFERISAGYTMMELNFGEKLLFIPGFRFESTYNEYTGVVGRAKRDDRRYNLRDTTSSTTKNNFLPMFHLRYRIIEGFSLRLAATKTLTRPDFLNLAPFERVEALAPGRGVVGRGSLGLKIPTAWNYDAILSYYSKIGLFSVAGFYKEIENIDVDAQFKDYSGTLETNPYYGYESENPINLDKTTVVKGIEFEVQTNLRFLPKPLDGIVLSGNYSIIRSESFYPYFPVTYPPPTYLPSVTDTFRSNSLQGQADYIVNFTVGYEKGGFSGRISMNYQGPKLNVSGAERFQDEFTAEYMRWDATLSQKVFDNWMILVNLINITSELERSYIFSEARPTLEEYYGWQANLGIRYSF